DGTAIRVGTNDNAGLRLQGSADKPVKFAGLRDEAGSWEAIYLRSNSRDSILENVVLRDAGGDAGVEVGGGANAKITNLKCEKCAAAALSYECDSKVTASGVSAAEGTPTGEKKPEGCQ